MKSVLLVEDDKNYRDILIKKLHEIGVTVYPAENGEVALNQLKIQPVNLIVLDLIMPKMDGSTFLYHLNQMKVSVPVIILTNLSESAIPNMTVTYLVKSDTSLERFIEVVKRHLGL